MTKEEYEEYRVEVMSSRVPMGNKENIQKDFSTLITGPLKRLLDEGLLKMRALYPCFKLEKLEYPCDKGNPYRFNSIVSGDMDDSYEVTDDVKKRMGIIEEEVSTTRSILDQ